MKFTYLLPLAALGAKAFVVPNEQVFSELAIEDTRGQATQEPKWSKDEVLDSFKKHLSEIESTVESEVDQASSRTRNILDDALAYMSDTSDEFSSALEGTLFDAKSWIDSAADSAFDALDDDHEGHPHGRPPHRKHPHDRPPHHGPPHHGPPHHHKPNLTVYQLIAESKYTTKLAKLINEYPDLVEALNGTKSNYTIFAPTDKAFERIPHHHKPSKEQIEKILQYHVSPDFYPAGRVLQTYTIPTLLKGEHLPGEDSVQRLSISLGVKGLAVNFYSRIVAIDIFGTNGVIHGVDHIILPPPKVIKIIDLLPTEFSTLELGLAKTGLYEEFNSTDHPGGTLFAPSNFAFAKLGPRINAFLFSSAGLKYLKALILYHTVPYKTVYSDAYYEAKAESGDPNKGYFHFDLPTALEGNSLSVDVFRYGGYISFKVNGFARVTVKDGVADDGVIQVVSDVLIPPKKASGLKSKLAKWNFWSAGEEEMSVEEFVERLQPIVDAKIDL
ncbi:hypothetical protein MBLNU459_g1811t1 [Dothideomycetes sp. NU459]